MATTTARLHAELTAEDEMSKVFKKAGDAAKKLQDGFKGIQDDAKEFGAQFGVIAGVGVLALKNFVDAASESERVTSQLNAVLESTGGVAGVTADMAANLAGSLQSVTTIGDEAILTGENMLLTFTNIGKDVFPQATEAMLDMAVGLNGGLTPSTEALKAQAIQLGKALNDPTQGMTALRKVGVAFTEDQTKLIEKLQKSGDIMGAQKIILDELAKEYGGSARAAAQTFSGQLEQMKERMGEISEELGRAVIPLIQAFSSKLGEMITWFESLSPQQKDFVAQTILIGTALAGAVAGAGLLVAALNPITLTVAAVVAGFAYLSAKLAENGLTWEEFGVSVQVVWAQFRYDVEYNVDLIIWKMRKLTLATDAELKQMAADMDVHLAYTQKEVEAGQTRLVEIYQEKQAQQKKVIEDGIAAQRDTVDTSMGEMKEVARAKLEAMKQDGLQKFADLKLGSTAELAAMRAAEEAELEKMNAMVSAKFAEQVSAAVSWGQGLIQNFTNGVLGKIPALQSAVATAKALINSLHQSYNPELPAKLWGQHFIENFTAGLKDSMPKLAFQTDNIKGALQGDFGAGGEVPKIAAAASPTVSVPQSSAPVQLASDNQSKQVTVNINMGGVQIAKEVDAENFFTQMETRLTRSVELQQLASL